MGWEQRSLESRIVRAIGPSDPLALEDTIAALRASLVGDLYGPDFEALGDDALAFVVRDASRKARHGRTRHEKLGEFRWIASMIRSWRATRPLSRGATSLANPYEWGSDAHKAWDSGWLIAERDDES